MWRNPNALGETLVAGALSGDTMENIARSRLTVHRGLRVIIALHRHYKVHGTLPTTLDELVPAFLPAVPLDPFDFKPLRWDAAKRAVYAIGTDRREQPPDFEEGTNSSGWWLLTTPGFKAPGVRFRTKAEGPDFPPGTTPPVQSHSRKPGPKQKPAPAKP